MSVKTYLVVHKNKKNQKNFQYTKWKMEFGCSGWVDSPIPCGTQGWAEKGLKLISEIIVGIL